MKKATRIARRIEREKIEKEMQIEKEKRQALYNLRFKQQKSKERVQFYKSLCKGLCWVAVFAVPISIMAHYDNIEADKRQVVLDSKLTAWNTYKNKNCKEVEKLFGMQMGSGKYRYVDDGTVYQCNNGMKYTLSDKAAKGEMGLDSIPNIPN